MSLTIIESEIRGFLSSPRSEVLCIKGKWGVGKTYGWRSILSNAKRDNIITSQKYSYVSLFGLNSQSELRYSIFENTVSRENIGRSPDISTISELITDKDTTRKFGRLLEWAGAVFNRKGIVDLLSSSAFLLVRDQLICLDDLERAGSGLGARQVLGLTSLLKEERRCKVVLLLNEEEHDDRLEFARQLEKVADLTLVYNPTPIEAAQIVLSDLKKPTTLLKRRVIELGIRNIRVVKKIHRLTETLVDILRDYDDSIIDEAVTTLALASWAVQQPSMAPSLEFIRRYNRQLDIIRSESEKSGSGDEKFRAQLAGYPFRGGNSLTQVIINGAEAGYFNASDILVSAETLVRDRTESAGDRGFHAIWEKFYNEPLGRDDDEFLNELYEVSLREITAINSMNVNTTISLLRQCDRNQQADSLIEHFINANKQHGVDFFIASNHHFISKEDFDPALLAAFESACASYEDQRSLREIFQDILKHGHWSEGDIRLLAKQTINEFVSALEDLPNSDLCSVIKMIQALSLSNDNRGREIAKNSTDALRQISTKSKLRACKIRALGINLETDPVLPAQIHGNGSS